MKRLIMVCLSICLILSLLPLSHTEVQAEEPVLAFPGAEGGGKYAKGGRGGSVYYVTTLEDYKPGEPVITGSLRDAVSESNRTILFAVSGTIMLKDRLSIKSSNLTIAGESAPGDGITIAGYDVYLNGEGLENGLNDIIIRYLRFRPGSEYVDSMPGWEADSIWGRDLNNVILDHISASWATDETGSFYRNKNFTLQWSILSESLTMSGHEKGRHGYGGIWGGENASFLNNLFVHHTSRLPRFEVGGNTTPATIDMQNNVLYNWGFQNAHAGDTASVNIINNYYKPGPNTEQIVINRIAEPIFNGSNWYINGNYMVGDAAVTADNMKGVTVSGNVNFLNEPVPTTPYNATSAVDAYELVLAKAGATYPKRDAVDARIINEVKKGTGRFINREYEVGGFPYEDSIKKVSIEEIEVYDSNLDGVPDAWLTDNYGAVHGSQLHGDSGYTYLELYLHELADMKHRPTNPDVFITLPANNNTYIQAGEELTITANATAASGKSIERVEFFVNDELIDTVVAAPYTTTWEAPTADRKYFTYYVSAKAVDSDGLMTQATAVSVIVNDPPISAPWTATDIGTVGAQGVTTEKDGVIQVKGAGAIHQYSDAFHFAYQPLIGDGEMTVKVTDFSLTDHDTVSGIMIRDSLDPDSSFALISTARVKASNQNTPFSVHFASRAQKGSAALVPLVNSENETMPIQKATDMPIWLKLVRVDNQFTGYTSYNGTDWTEVHSRQINMDEHVYIGLAVDAAKKDNQTNNIHTAEFTDVSYTNYAAGLSAYPPPFVNTEAFELKGQFVRQGTVEVKLNGERVGEIISGGAEDSFSRLLTFMQGNNTVEVIISEAGQPDYIKSYNVDYINFTISQAVFQDANGQVIDELMPNSEVVVFSEVSNNMDQAKDGVMVVGLFDGQDQLVNFAFMPVQLAANATETFQAGFKLPSQIRDYEIRVLIWDDYEAQSTISNVATIAASGIIIPSTPPIGNYDTITDPNTGETTITLNEGALLNTLNNLPVNAKGKKQYVLNVPTVSDHVNVELPADLFRSEYDEAEIILKMNDIAVTIPGNMLSNFPLEEQDQVTLQLSKVDHADLPESVRSAIGQRPVYHFDLLVNGESIQWHNANASFNVSIAYTPTAEELANDQFIVAWFIDAEGNVTPITSSKYDASTGTLNFSTNHFSQYAVTYDHKTFTDLTRHSWAKHEIDVLASRGVINGVSATHYAPERNITRADFTLLLVRALGLSRTIDDNFADIAPHAYYYDGVGVARAYGIIEGRGDNRFYPTDNITRQDMFVIAARALRQLDLLQAESESSILDHYTDNALISNYALLELATLVENGLVEGYDSKLNPLGLATRAEAAVFIYRLFYLE